jgi:hypothetical protein
MTDLDAIRKRLELYKSLDNNPDYVRDLTAVLAAHDALALRIEGLKEDESLLDWAGKHYPKGSRYSIREAITEQENTKREES